MTARKTAKRARPGVLGRVQQLPSGRWRARYSRDGVTFKAPHTFATKADAHTWLAAERADRARGVWLDPRLGTETLADYARSWLDTRAELSPRSRAYYRNAIERHIVPRVGGESVGIALGGYCLAEVTPAVVRRWRALVLTATRQRIAARRAAKPARTLHPARAWAIGEGIDIPRTGAIPGAVRAAWERAGSPEPDQKPTPSPAVLDESDDAGATTAAHAYSTLRTILNEAVRDGLIPSNPCQIRGGGVVHPRERPTATPAEVAKIAEAMPAHLAAAVIVAAWSGLRRGELFALARCHVDVAAGTVRVERALSYVPGEPVKFGKPKTHSSRRTVYLPPFVAEVLARHLSEHVGPEASALLFTTAGGAPVQPSRLDAPFKRARAAAGRSDLRWHDLRHTGATLAYSAGASVREVQNRLGHSTMRAASIYAHAADDSDRVLAARLDALYSQNTPKAAEVPERSSSRIAA